MVKVAMFVGLTDIGVAPKELLSQVQKLNTKSRGDQNEPPNASRVFIPDLDSETSVAEVEEVLDKLRIKYLGMMGYLREYSKPSITPLLRFWLSSSTS